jgi:hypothetical protein
MAKLGPKKATAEKKVWEALFYAICLVHYQTSNIKYLVNQIPISQNLVKRTI